MNPSIFLSYRRDDSAGHTGRLHDHLRQRFGESHVFMDVDTLEPGVDFVLALENTLESCDVLLAVIGRKWLAAADVQGAPRLQQENDFVRLEIETALKRRIRVIPVLVQGASMPRSEDLPPELADLTRRHAIELTDTRWTYDVGRLIETLQHIEPSAPSSSAIPRARRGGWYGLALAGIAVALLIAGFFAFRMRPVVPAKETPADATRPTSGASAQWEDSCGERHDCVILAMWYELHRDTGNASTQTRAMDLYLRGCNGAEPMGCFWLASVYEKGEGVAADRGRARDLYRRAHTKFTQDCQKDDAEACFGLAQMYDVANLLVQPDQARAADLYRRAETLAKSACARGEAAGCVTFGEFQAAGHGSLTPDLERARRLWTEACDKGSGAGCYELALATAPAEMRHRQLLERACALRSAVACLELSRLQSR